MNPAYCVNCGTKRDARFIESDGKCIAVHCLPCGTSLPCCPECGITGIRRAENQLALECPSCEVTFPDPKREARKWELAPAEIRFLLDIGESLSSHIGKLRSFDQYEEKLGREISEIRYISNELKYLIVIPKLLKWRRQVLSAGAGLPDIKYIENSLLADSSHYKPSPRVRNNMAGILKELLALLTALVILRNDCRSFTLYGQRFGPDEVGEPQGKAIKFFIEEAEAGRPDVPIGLEKGQKIHTEMGIPFSSRVKDYFTNSGLWDHLIIKKKQGFRRLAVYPKNYEIPTS